MNGCTCQESWEEYLTQARKFTLAVSRAKVASFRWTKISKDEFKDAWDNHDKCEKAIQEACDAHLEARKNCPVHGLREKIG